MQASDEIVRFRELVEREVIVEQEPPPREPNVIERVRFVSPRPVRHQIATGGAELEVASFCEPAIRTARGEEDPDDADPELLLRSVVYDEPGLLRVFDKGEITLTGVTSHGDLEARDYRVRGSWDATVVDGDPVVRYGRLGLARDVFEGVSQLWAVYSLLNLGWSLVK